MKWGLAGYPPAPGWGEDLLDTRRELPVGMEMVAVAYADWERAKSVAAGGGGEVRQAVPLKAFLLDTWGKDGKTLLDFMTRRRRRRAGGGPEARLHDGGGRRALRPEHVEATEGRAPRTTSRSAAAACAGGKRDGVIDAARVHEVEGGDRVMQETER